MNGSTFTGGLAYYGGAIAAISFTYLNISNSTFINNYAKTSSDAIYASSSTNYLEITRSNFSSTIPTNFVTASDITNVTIYKSTFNATINNVSSTFSGLTLNQNSYINLT